jgi:hypothetical protein
MYRRVRARPNNAEGSRGYALHRIGEQARWGERRRANKYSAMKPLALRACSANAKTESVRAVLPKGCARNVCC